MGTEDSPPASARRDDPDRWAPAGLLSNPPLLDRLRWREGIRPQTLISRDRGLMARTFGTLYLVGGLVGFVILAIGDSADRNDAAIAVISVVSLALAAVCFVVYRRLPAGFFAALVTFGTLLITGGAAAADGIEGVYGFFYVWVVFPSFLFFSPRVAALQSLLAAGAYAVVLFANDAEFAVNLLVSAVATIGTTGALIGLLMARVERVAVGLAADAHTDPVTAIANRRDFDERFERAVERARRSDRPLALVICDLDRFKQVNDELGHEEGDVALRRAAEAITAAVRSMDAVARLGGEEFGVILPDTDTEMATQVAERVRGAITDEFEAYPVSLTASCGVASTRDAIESEEGLFRAADNALYAAKRAGRNRTVAHGDESEG